MKKTQTRNHLVGILGKHRGVYLSHRISAVHILTPNLFVFFPKPYTWENCLFRYSSWVLDRQFCYAFFLGNYTTHSVLNCLKAHIFCHLIHTHSIRNCSSLKKLFQPPLVPFWKWIYNSLYGFQPSFVSTSSGKSPPLKLPLKWQFLQY